MKQLLKHEIERVAPGLAVDQSGAVRIPPQGKLSLARADGPGLVFCNHANIPQLTEASRRVTGVFRLNESEDFLHSFVTEAGREEFTELILEACEKAAASRSEIQVSWNEEWGLTRTDKPEAGVFVIGGTPVWDGIAAIEGMLAAGRQKFLNRRWANLHVLTFHSAMSPDEVSSVLASYSKQEVPELDLVLVATDDDVRLVWPQD